MKFEDLRNETAESLDAKRVDCYSCPVNIRCAIGGQEGTGFTFNCCRVTSVYMINDERQEVLVVVDCAKHNFHQTAGFNAGERTCPLCTGGAVYDEENCSDGDSEPYRYLPTIHSKVSSETRLAAMAKFPKRKPKEP
jgi:hypothetical protein